MAAAAEAVRIAGMDVAAAMGVRDVIRRKEAEIGGLMNRFSIRYIRLDSVMCLSVMTVSMQALSGSMQE